MGSLLNLQLSNNRFDSIVPESYKNLKRLQTINLKGNRIKGGFGVLTALPSINTIDLSDVGMSGRIDLYDLNISTSLIEVDFSNNPIETDTKASDYKLPTVERPHPLIVHITGIRFDCPFPTPEQIRAVNIDSNKIVLLHEQCHPQYGVFLIYTLIPIMGCVGVLFVCWKILKRIPHPHIGRCTRPMKLDHEVVNSRSHFRLKLFRIILFAVMCYDTFNDASVYVSMFDTISGDPEPDPCVLPNDRILFESRMPISWYNWDTNNTVFPDTVCDKAYENCHLSGYTNFTSYLALISDPDQLILQQDIQTNVNGFELYCVNFFVSDDLNECAYSETKCTRVRNIRRSKNEQFKKYLIASAVIISAKELIKLLFVVQALFFPNRHIGNVEIGLIAQTPLMFVLILLRKNFVSEYFNTPSTFKNMLIAILVEDVCGSINTLIIGIYYAKNITDQGLEGNILLSIASCTVFLLNDIKKLYRQYRKQSGGATIHLKSPDNANIQGV